MPDNSRDLREIATSVVNLHKTEGGESNLVKASGAVRMLARSNPEYPTDERIKQARVAVEQAVKDRDGSRLTRATLGLAVIEAKTIECYDTAANSVKFHTSGSNPAEVGASRAANYAQSVYAGNPPDGYIAPTIADVNKSLSSQRAISQPQGPQGSGRHQGPLGMRPGNSLGDNGLPRGIGSSSAEEAASEARLAARRAAQPTTAGTPASTPALPPPVPEAPLTAAVLDAPAPTTTQVKVNSRVSGALKGAGAAMATHSLMNGLENYINGKSSEGELGVSAAPAALVAADVAISKVAASGEKLATTGKVLGHSAILAGAAIPLIEASLDEDKAKANGDGYGLVIASTRGNYRALAALGSAGTGAAAGSVLPAYGTAVGGVVGLASGIYYDTKANELAIEAANKDPQKLAEAAALQASMDQTVNSPKIDDLLSKAKAIGSDEALNKIEEYAKDHTERKTLDQLSKFDARMQQLDTAYKNYGVDEAGKKIYPGDQRFLNQAQETADQLTDNLSGSHTSPISKEGSAQAEWLLKQAQDQKKFLEERPVTADWAIENRKGMLERLDEVIARTQPVVMAAHLDEKIASKAAASIDIAVSSKQDTLDGVKNSEKYLSDRLKNGTLAIGESAAATSGAHTQMQEAAANMQMDIAAMRQNAEHVVNSAEIKRQVAAPEYGNMSNEPAQANELGNNVASTLSAEQRAAVKAVGAQLSSAGGQDSSQGSEADEMNILNSVHSNAPKKMTAVVASR